MTENTQRQYAVCALYKFTALPDYESLRQPVLDQLLTHEIRGTLLLAEEGINGTISGPESGIQTTPNAEPRGLGRLRKRDSFRIRIEIRLSCSVSNLWMTK